MLDRTDARCDGASQDGTGSSSYSLGSGDQLQVVVFRQPDLSGEFSLDREGHLALPLVGEIAAGDLTTRQLEDEIESRLKAGGFLVSPQVGVQLVTYRSFYILGEVGTPGSYKYRNGITALAAVALAGGYTARADRSSVTIGRGDCLSPPKPIRPSIRATSLPLPSGSSDRSPALPTICLIRTTWQELRHEWLTQISRADRGIG